MDFRESVAERYARMANRTAERLMEDKEISERNKELILEYRDKAIAQDDIKAVRVVKLVSHMHQIAKWLGKDLDKATKNDLMLLVGKIRAMKYKDWTKHSYLGILKKYYKIMEGDNIEAPKKAKFIKSRVKKTRQPANAYLSQENIYDMLNACQNNYERAVFSTLYDGAFRYAEFAGIQRRHVSFGDGGVEITVTGKTGPRTIGPLIVCEPYLATWMSETPGKGAEDYVFCHRAWNYQRRPLTVGSLSAIIKRLAERAGVAGRKLNPHSIRHARLTYLSDFLSGAQLCDFAGWIQGSEQMQTYVHGTQMRQKLRANLGINDETLEQDKIFRKKECPRCQQLSPGTTEICTNCGLSLEIKTSEEYQDKRKTVNDLIERRIEARVKKLLEERGISL